MMTEKIKACPYCPVPTVTMVFNPDGDDAFVECSRCKTQGPSGKNEAEAIAKWNAAANALSKKDAEIDELNDGIAEVIKNHDQTLQVKQMLLDKLERDIAKLSTNLQLERKRVAAGDKRQDELETEIARLVEACDDLEGEYLRMKDERDEARKVARRYYQESERKDGDITRLREEIDKVNALRPIGEPPIIAYYTPHGQPVSVTNNPVSYTRTEPQTIRVAETSESDGN